MIANDIISKNKTVDVTELIQDFDQIVAENEGKIFNIIYSFIGDYDDALDLTQETFICAYQNIHRFRQESSLSTWLYTIAINVCKKRHNKRKKILSIFVDSIDNPKTNAHVINQALLEPSADKSIELDEEETLIRKEISLLSNKYKSVIILKYIQGLSYEEIADIIKCNVGTVKSRLSRAKEKLKPKLKKLMEGNIQ